MIVELGLLPGRIRVEGSELTFTEVVSEAAVEEAEGVGVVESSSIELVGTVVARVELDGIPVLTILVVLAATEGVSGVVMAGSDVESVELLAKVIS